MNSLKIEKVKVDRKKSPMPFNNTQSAVRKMRTADG